MDKVENLAELGRRLKASDELKEKIVSAEKKNPWFVQQFAKIAMESIINEMLDRNKLTQWLMSYDLKQVNKTIGLIFAGNIPLVGFHDFLCCYVAGCKIKIKLSSKDDELFFSFLKLLREIDSAIDVEIIDTLKNFDAVIATGSDNTNRYFEYYFRPYPKILRKNRNSVAILTGNETEEDLQMLSDDIFLYFGFGCRNVSKIYAPVGYDFTQLFPAFERNYKWLHQHSKYMSNYDYNRTILMLNKTPHLANEFVMLIENPSISSTIATVHYEHWHDENVLNAHLKQEAEKIQCVSSTEPERWRWTHASSSVLLGQTQYPQLSDYADGVDTLAFILGLAVDNG